MSLNLAVPLAWRQASAAEQAALDNLQGNILKSHGRSHTRHLFLRFDAADAAGTRRYLAWLGTQATSALRQLRDADTFRRTHRSSGAFVAVLVSASGYRKLGVRAAQMPANPAFKAGMKARRALLNDPPVNKWDAAFRGDVDAMILIAGDTAPMAKTEVGRLLARRPRSTVLLNEETGHAYKNANGDGIEHFGYVDGRSQPLLLVEDVERENSDRDGTHVWDPAFPLRQVLVRSRGGGPNDFGSYFVFRKLEQNVKSFQQREQQLATALGLKGADRDLAGAMAIGRFRDGTPISLQRGPGMHNPVPNNFNFDGDESGHKCPFHSHIRKCNPRGESATQRRESVPLERARLMARRGITYEEPGKTRKTKSDGAGIRFIDQPSGGVGLLFLACQQDIGKQFEFAQQRWINDPEFVANGASIDPIAGQGTKTTQRWPTAWGSAERKGFSFESFVRMKGGEYFFAPPLSFLKSLAL